MKHYKIRVFGKVQGVWFRHSTMEKARQLGLTGKVENMSDGSVDIEAEGDEKKIQELIDWCQQGPEHATVEDISFSEDEPKNYQDFSIS